MIGRIGVEIGLIEPGIGLIELGIGLIELGIGLIEVGIGLIELGIGLIRLGISLIELGIGLRINDARCNVLARVPGLVLHLFLVHFFPLFRKFSTSFQRKIRERPFHCDCLKSVLI